MHLLSDAIKTFADNLSALRDFVRLVRSILDDRQRELLKQHRKDFIPVALLMSHINLGSKAKISENRMHELEEEFGTKLEITEGADNEGSKSWSVRFDSDTWNSDPIISFISTETRHKALLYRSALISLVSAAEWFLSQVIRTYFEKFPGASGVEGKTLTLQDLSSLGSVEDARKYLVDLRIDEIMWGSFEDWLRFLTGTMKLSAGYLETDKDSLVEVFLRRNVMVHNNGRVHSSYIQRTAPELRKDITQGEELGVSPEYLSKAIDLVEKNFILLAAELWKQLQPSEEERAHVMIDVAFERLKSDIWTVSEGLSFFTLNDRKVSERSQLVAQLNYWQSRKWQGKFNDVKGEIEAADLTAKDDLFQLARLALLDDSDRFFKAVPAAIRSKKLTKEMLATWPIFRQMRKDRRFKKYENRTDKPSRRKDRKKHSARVNINVTK